MRALVAGFVIGVVWLQQQAALPDFLILSVLFAISLTGVILVRRSSQAYASGLARTICGALFGIIWTSLIASHYLSESLSKEWEGRDVTVIGTINSLPHHFERGVRFHFNVERLLTGAAGAADIPTRLALSWYAGFGMPRSKDFPIVRPGERWQLTVRLKRPHGNANPYGFDYEAWLLGQRVRATGYVRPDKKLSYKNQRLDAFVLGAGSLLHRSRGWLRDRIDDALPEKAYAGMIAALVMGDQRSISQRDWEVFRRTNISHLFAISGLHITLFASLSGGLMLALWRRSFFTRAQLPLILPAQKAAVLTGAVAALLYAAISGFGVPAQRSLTMLLVVAAALWLGRVTSLTHVLALALGVTVLLDPWATLWPGFWLSFGAVAVILYASVGRTQDFSGDESSWASKWRHKIRVACMTQYAITLGLVPLTVLLFGQISLVSPLENALAIPLVTLLIMPLALVGSILPKPFVTWVLTWVHQLIEWLVAALAWLSDFSFAVWQAPTPALWVVMLALSGTFWMLAPRGWPSRWLGVFCWLPLFTTAPNHPAFGEMWVTAFDVGQGSALLIETEKHRMLLDTGPQYSSHSDAGQRVILPYLYGRGIHVLDELLVTHGDQDHAGGAASVLAALDVGSVLSSMPAENGLAINPVSYRRCESGQKWTWDGVQFELLSPESADYAFSAMDNNARSCVLRIQAGDHAILLPGDIGKKQEQRLVARYGKALQSTVLLAPHHGGSKTSSPAFLRAVSPEFGLFQVGYLNPYGHPRPDVLARYQKMGIKMLRTDESGAIRLHFSAGLDVYKYRKEEARYWHQR